MERREASSSTQDLSFPWILKNVVEVKLILIRSYNHDLEGGLALEQIGASFQQNYVAIGGESSQKWASSSSPRFNGKLAKSAELKHKTMGNEAMAFPKHEQGKVWLSK